MTTAEEAIQGSDPFALHILNTRLELRRAVSVLWISHLQKCDLVVQWSLPGIERSFHMQMLYNVEAFWYQFNKWNTSVETDA